MPSYRVNEVYPAIQGEGYWTGRPCTIVRLQGCNLSCPFCDTEHAIERDKGHSLPLDDLVLLVERYHQSGRIILLTGGEPLFQRELGMLIQKLTRLGPVHLETNGTLSLSGHPAWVTVSPKPPSYKVKPSISEAANEIKWLVSDQASVEALRKFLRAYKPGVFPHVFVQPVSLDPDSTMVAYYAAMAYGWNLSLQTHKLIGRP